MARYSGSNGDFEWVRTYAGPKWDRISGLDLDSDGNIVGTGHFMEEIGTTLTGHGSLDIFVTKIRPNGIEMWSRSFGGPGWDQGMSVAVDRATDDIILTGTFSQTATFGGQTRTAFGDEDIFVLHIGR